MAIATGGLYLASAIGMLLGMTSSSAVQLGTLKSLLEAGLRSFPGRDETLRRVMENVTAIQDLGDL